MYDAAKTLTSFRLLICQESFRIDLCACAKEDRCQDSDARKRD